jgi:hypothetical protein
MMMVEQFANSPPCTLGDSARSLDGANAYILAGHSCTLADIAGGVEGVKRDKVARTLSNSLRRRSSALGCSFADVSGAPANVAAGAGLMGLPLCGRLRCAGRLRWGLCLVVLTNGELAGECESNEHDG